VLALVDVKLQLVDVRGMAELEVLDLRNNLLSVRAAARLMLCEFA
jgi:hypothetical protein